MTATNCNRLQSIAIEIVANWQQSPISIWRLGDKSCTEVLSSSSVHERSVNDGVATRRHNDKSSSRVLSSKSTIPASPVSSMMAENLATFGSRRMIGAVDVVVSMARWLVCVVDERLLWRSMRLGAAILERSKRCQPEIEPDPHPVAGTPDVISLSDEYQFLTCFVGSIEYDMKKRVQLRACWIQNPEGARASEGENRVWVVVKK